ncbi:helix-turn-helix transcriptional regulator [Rhodanobacter sp. DHB23]|uniref:helix-turn-helix transcriptional regulator n=1 Tax=Rhodanobacter sp. DHB23 TaxID=2775923 RepID=UPI00177DA78B|nr:helix-turn-helix transcriptional regulator [Rhodanobacter sp. DHB23]MBD8874021.1 helix-turn-helix transcriptional regulator [Rhodanobacter sp. DHB23]
MISLDTFSELLQVLYSAPLEQEQWQRFLTLLCGYTGSSSGAFISANDHLRLSALAAGGAFLDQPWVESYNEEYAQTDPFRGAAARQARVHNPAGVYSENDLLPNDGLLQTPFYRELLTKANLRYGAFTVLAMSVRRLDVFSLWRTPDEGPVDSDSRRLLELLLPHVQTALEMHRRLKVAGQQRAGAEILADTNPAAIFILTADGTVRHCNAAAESLARVGDGLMVRQGRLVPGKASSSHELERLIGSAAMVCSTAVLPPSSHALLLHRASGKRPLQVVASPLPEDQRVDSGGEVLLVATDPEAITTFPDDLLRQFYGLTAAEIEVANGLLLGYAVEEIACLRRVSAGTVRQQIKSMLAKTDTRRQADMVRLFMRLPQTNASSVLDA